MPPFNIGYTLDSAVRDINDLVQRGMLIKEPGGGRCTAMYCILRGANDICIYSISKSNLTLLSAFPSIH